MILDKNFKPHSVGLSLSPILAQNYILISTTSGVKLSTSKECLSMILPIRIASICIYDIYNFR